MIEQLLWFRPRYELDIDRCLDQKAGKTLIISYGVVENFKFLTLNACGLMPGEVILFLLRSIHSKLGIPLNASSEIVVMLFPIQENNWRYAL